VPANEIVETDDIVAAFVDQDGIINPEEFHYFLWMNSDHIDWDSFNAWVKTVKDKRGFSRLQKAYHGWEDDEILPWEEVAKDIEKNLDIIDSNDMFDWLIANEERIDWDKFEIWANLVEDKPGYEFLHEIFDDGYGKFATAKVIWDMDKDAEEGVTIDEIIANFVDD